MNYLLDTHALLWALFDHKRLPKGVSDTILDPEHAIYVSVVSFWEIALKFSIGKITLSKVAPDDLPSFAEKAGFEILGISADEASSFYKLPKVRHKDPFDRLIIWQCIQNNLVLITKDGGMAEYSSMGLRVCW